MLKQGLSIDITFYPPQLSLDSTFKPLKQVIDYLKSKFPLDWEIIG
jgi:hypothetical protein